MRSARSALVVSIALMTAAALAGCFGGDEPSGDTGGGTGGGTGGTGGGTGGTGGGTGGTGGGTGGTGGGTGGTGGGTNTTFTPYNGTAGNVAGGPQASGSVTIDVKAGAKALTVSFVHKGNLAGTALAGTAIQNFMATLTDANGNETGTANSVTGTIGATNPAKGSWTVAVTYASPPTESIDVLFDVA